MKRVTNHSFILKVNGRAAEIKSNCEITREVKFASCIKAQVNKQIYKYMFGLVWFGF